MEPTATPASSKQSSTEPSVLNSAAVGSEAREIIPNEKAGEPRKSRATGGLFLRSLPVVAQRDGGKPRPSFYRMSNPGPVLLRNNAEAEMPTMVGHFCAFNRWTHIDSWFEGEFMERVAPGATIKTIKDNRANMKVLFNHGRDVVGKQILGPIEEVREDEVGTYFAVPLLDTSYNRDLIPGLELPNNGYGCSYQFRVMKESVISNPKRSDFNPHGIEERTIEEMEVMEFGPVTFPQYTETDVSLRSLTDDILTEELFLELTSDSQRLIQLLGKERMQQIVEAFDPALAAALSHDRAADPALGGESRDEEHEFPALVVVRNPNKAR